MSVQEETKWITGAEFGEARRRLILAGKGVSPEMDRLWKLARERDEYLWKKYAEPLIDSHRGEFAAVSLNGELILGRTRSEVGAEAARRFGEANFVSGKLDEFRGIRLRGC